jgi:hypothetical protein
MKKNILIILFYLFVTGVQSQVYDTIVRGNDTILVFKALPADSLRKAGDLEGAIESYKQLYLAQGEKFTELYNYACALSVDRQLDSAFRYLSMAVEKDATTASLCDPDFLNLRKDLRWAAFEDTLISSIEVQHKLKYRDREYAKKLWYLHALDQAYYDCIETAEARIGRNSPVVLALWDLKGKINETNQEELEKLIEQKGWPRKSQVGESASSTAFLIIQHSDSEKQKKYLPVIEELCKENEARWADYALMYDRIQISDNKPQKYGSQINFNNVTKTYELCPLLDETRVDEWRKEVGLGPLSEYVANWNFKFEPKKK